MLYDILTYPLRAWHRKGYDVQSPWAYLLVRDVLFEEHPYYAYDELRLLRKSFSTAWQLSAEADEQLYRMANHFAPQSIVEIGLPQSACYMARPRPDAVCTAILPSAEGIDILQRLGINAVTGNVVQELQRVIPDGTTAGMVHMALPNDKVGASQTEQAYEWIAAHADAETVLVIEHINRSNRRLWKRIVNNDDRASVTFDLGRSGIVTFDHKRVKQNYLL